MKTMTRPGLAVLICAALALWGVSCFLIHGSAILAYAGLQAVTSGLFAYSFYRTEKALVRNQNLVRKDSPAIRSVPERQAVRVQSSSSSGPATSHPAGHQQASL